AAIFLRDGQPLQPGDRFTQPDLARSLEALSADGPDAMYRGPIGDAIVAASQAAGGILAKADFETYRVRELAPISCTYRGFLVQSAPPPSSGGIVLCEILNILEGYDLRALGFHGAAEIHVLVEAMRHAFYDRNEHLGDPDCVQNPVEHLLDKAYAASIRSTIEPERATPSATFRAGMPPHEGMNTTQFSVMDREGNAVSVTYTLNDWFGISRVAPGTGILLNNEMDDFTSKPGVPNMFGLVQGAANAIAPGKTPLSSMTPTIVSRGGKPVLIIGSPGGPRITTTTLEAIVNVIDHGMTVQEAIDAPRIHHQMLPDTVYIERFALSPDTKALLEQRGYGFTESAPWGVAEGIVAGAPRLTPSGFGAAQSLNLGLPDLPGAALFGAHDPRGPAGAAMGN
ncbi:MAG: gamma-glutamyltransferase, partial [Pseudomonadota bacterium]|nr:gamma-glutamyltransferase [Pseudomonadota bacterium]